MIRNGCSTFARMLAFNYSMLMAVLFLREMLFLCPDFSGAFGYQPFHTRILQLFPFLCSLITGIAGSEFFLAVQQVVQLVQVMLVGGGGHQCMRQAALGIHTNMDIHAEVPLVTFFGLVHLWVTFIPANSTPKCTTR